MQQDTDAFDATNQEEMSMRDALLARCIDVENDSDSEDDEEQDMYYMMVNTMVK